MSDQITYDELYELGENSTEQFWRLLANELYWHKSFDEVVNDSDCWYKPKWFSGGKLNMCYNCLDRNIELGIGDDEAIVHISVYTKATKIYTYKQIFDNVTKFAGVLREKCGLKKGDKVLINMPITPEYLFAMLACCRLGITYCPTFGGYPATEIVQRVQHFKPDLIIASNVGYHNNVEVEYIATLKTVLEKVNIDQNCQLLVFNRPYSKPIRVDDSCKLKMHIWNEVIYEVTSVLDVEPMNPSDPLFVIYTSGSTGKPKGLVIPNAAAVVEKYTGNHVFLNRRNITTLAISDFGWILGQSAMSYCCLLNQSRSILLEGDLVNPDGSSDLPNILNWYDVYSIFAPPTKFRKLRKLCTTKLKQNYPRLKCIFMGGENTDLELIKWIEDTFNCLYLNVWGQTELAGPCLAPCFGTPELRKDFVNDYNISKIPGIFLDIFDMETGEKQPRGSAGYIFLKMPLVPGLASTILDDDERYYNNYFSAIKGYFNTHDIGLITESGTIQLVGRSDDFLKVATVKVAIGHLETLCNNVDEVDETVVVGLNDEIIGQRPFAFLTLKSNIQLSAAEVVTKCMKEVYKSYGEVVKIKTYLVVESLPHTKTGKRCRKALAQLINGEKIENLGHVENPKIFDDIRQKLEKF